MKAYQTLTRSGQIVRLKSLAERTLAEYDLTEYRIVPLQHWLNTTFRIETKAANPQNTATERYMLRIQHPALHSEHAIRSELAWLKAIGRDTDLVVPQPLPNKKGALLTTASLPGIPQPRYCVIFHWVYGRFFRSQLGVGGLEQVGEFMAKLHNHTARYTPPAWFSRPRWDLAGLQGEALGIDPLLSRSVLAQEQVVILDSIAEKLGQLTSQLGEDSEIFGLIHADLYQGNYLFLDQKIRAIDFDSCGWGYYAYDIGVTFSTLQSWPNFPALRSAFLRGYRRFRTLPAELEASIPLFMAGRLMAHTLWLAGHLHEPGFGERARVQIDYQLGILKKILDRSKNLHMAQSHYKWYDE